MEYRTTSPLEKSVRVASMPLAIIPIGYTDPSTSRDTLHELPLASPPPYTRPVES
jgi:hypothetical protein